MATIKIKDLAESVDLDREAMLAVVGGARIRGRQAPIGRNLFRNERIVDYPSGLGSLSRRPAKESGGGRR